MKIVSPFKDYYDVGLANDRDPYPLFLRQPAEFESKGREKTYYTVRAHGMPYLPVSGHYDTLQGYGLRIRDSGAVAFCGRRYPFWIVDKVCCYTLPQIIATIKKKIDSYDDDRDYSYTIKPLKETLRALNGTQSNAPFSNGYGWGPLNVATWEAWQKHRESLGGALIKDELFLGEKTPVIAVVGERVLINPNLRKLNFHTVMDPYTAYQELSMFLGNNMAQQVDPIPKMTDELKAHAHGYDKWSFRTHKEDSKKTKKRKEKAAKKRLELRLDDSDFR